MGVVADAGTLRVVVADDSLLVREGLRRVLETVSEVDVVADSTDRDATLEAVAMHVPDVLLTDIRMPPTFGAEGIEIAHALRKTHPTVAVVLLSQYIDASYALALFDEGSASRGYLLKDRLAASEQLLHAIRMVAGGGAFVDPVVVDALLRMQAAQATSPFTSLTGGEREVLALVATGLSNAAIARQLSLNVRAVERRIGSIFEKLELSDEGRLNRRVAATLAYLAETA
jgi:DNA-binding NarL/FixJ family response regulator